MHLPQTPLKEAIHSEAVAAFSREMSNSLMILQNGLDQLRRTHKDQPQFQWMQGACNQATNAMHSTMSLLGGQLPGKENFLLGEYLEHTLPELQQQVTFPLALRTHDNCRIHASSPGLSHCLGLLLQYVAQTDEQELYIEVYSHEQEESHYGVITLNILGALEYKDTRWQMLKSMLLLQGAHLLEEPNDEGLRCHLMMEVAPEIQVSISNRVSVESATAIVVDSEPRIAELIATTLSAFGMNHVEIHLRPDTALKWLSQHTPSIALVEYNLPGMSGLELLKKAGPALAKTKIGLISGYRMDGLDTTLEALGLNAEILMKPFRGDDLNRIVMQAHQLEAESSAAEQEATPESFKNTMRLKSIPTAQQCPTGFLPDSA